jgi:hypothetical protein
MEKEKRDVIYGIIGLISLFIPLVLLLFIDLTKGYWIYFTFNIKNCNIDTHRYYFRKDLLKSDKDMNSNIFTYILAVIFDYILLYFQYLFYSVLLLHFILMPILWNIVIYEYFKQKRDNK